MRIILVVCIMAMASPALADQAAADQYIAEQWEKIAAMRVANAKKAADLKSSCAKLGGARIGLDAEGVRRSCWGKPSRINSTLTAGHSHEQWVYGSSYVYLTDGVVTAIQTSR